MNSICKIDANGTKHWYLNGKLHREDGPASEYASGDKCWYLNDKLHREDGPAVEYASGDKCWYLNDIKYITPESMPLNLFLAYVKWELKKNV